MVFDLFARSHKLCRPGHVSLDYAYQTRLIDVSQLRHLDGDSTLCGCVYATTKEPRPSRERDGIDHGKSFQGIIILYFQYAMQVLYDPKKCSVLMRCPTSCFRYSGAACRLNKNTIHVPMPNPARPMPVYNPDRKPLSRSSSESDDPRTLTSTVPAMPTPSAMP